MTLEELVQSKVAETMEKEGYKMTMTEPDGNVIDGPRNIIRYIIKKIVEWLKEALEE